MERRNGCMNRTNINTDLTNSNVVVNYMWVLITIQWQGPNSVVLSNQIRVVTEMKFRFIIIFLPEDMSFRLGVNKLEG